MHVMCSVLLASLYVVIVVFVVVDLTTVSKNAYNIVSISGIITYIIIMFVFSTNPAKVGPSITLYSHNIWREREREQERKRLRDE